MRAAAISFLVVCFHLLVGYHVVHAANYHHTPVADIQKAQSADGTNKGYLVTKNDGSGLQYDHLITSEEEDEDELAPRKFILLERYFLTLSHAIISNNCCSSPANQLPSCRHLSYIGSHQYITQRVLRI